MPTAASGVTNEQRKQDRFRESIQGLDLSSLIEALGEIELDALPEEDDDPDKHGQPYVAAVLRSGAEISDRNTARKMAQFFLDKAPAYSKSKAGIAAAMFEAWLASESELSQVFVETVLENDSRYTVLFEGPLKKHALERMHHETQGFTRLTMLAEAGAVANGEVFEFTVMEGRPTGGTPDNPEKEDHGSASAQARADHKYTPSRSPAKLTVESLVPQEPEDYQAIIEEGGIERRVMDVILLEAQGLYSYVDDNLVAWRCADGVWTPQIDEMVDRVNKPQQYSLPQGSRKVQPGMVVKYKGRGGRRYLVLSTNQWGQLAMTALSGGLRGSFPSQVKPDDVVPHEEQSKGFEGKLAMKLRAKAAQYLATIHHYAAVDRALDKTRLPDAEVAEVQEDYAIGAEDRSWCLVETFDEDGAAETVAIVEGVMRVIPYAPAWIFENLTGEIVPALEELMEEVGVPVLNETYIEELVGTASPHVAKLDRGFAIRVSDKGSMRLWTGSTWVLENSSADRSAKFFKKRGDAKEELERAQRHWRKEEGLDESPPLVPSIAKKQGETKERAERLWKKAERIVKDQYPDKKGDDFYKLATGIFKKMMRVPEEGITLDEGTFLVQYDFKKYQPKWEGDLKRTFGDKNEGHRVEASSADEARKKFGKKHRLNPFYLKATAVADEAEDPPEKDEPKTNGGDKEPPAKKQ